MQTRDMCKLIENSIFKEPSDHHRGLDVIMIIPITTR